MGLNISTKNKLSLSFIFGFGSLYDTPQPLAPTRLLIDSLSSDRICIISLFRLKAIIDWSMQDGPYTNRMVAIWTCLESTLGIICACIVVMRPLFRRIFPDRLKISKVTKKPNTDPSKLSRSKPTLMFGWVRSNGHSQGLSGNRADSSNELQPGRFQRLDEDMYPLQPGLGSNNATTAKVNVTPAGKIESAVPDIEAQHPKRDFSRGAIMVKQEWEINSVRA